VPSTETVGYLKLDSEFIPTFTPKPTIFSNSADAPSFHAFSPMSPLILLMVTTSEDDNAYSKMLLVASLSVLSAQSEKQCKKE